jgi:hypothetical protein
MSKCQALHFPNFLALKEEYKTIILKPSNSLFTYDAIKMHPAIPTDTCCERLEGWFKLPE